MGEHLEVLQHDVAVFYAHRVVGEPYLHAVRLGEQAARVEKQLAVGVGLRRRAFQRERSLGVTLEAEEPVGHEAVDEVHWHVRHVERGVEHAFAHREVSALERAELLAVLGDDAIHVVAAARLWHVSELRAHVAQGAAVICHLVHVDRRGHGQLLLRLREVDVAVEHARDVGRVRNDRQYLAYVEPVE